MRSSSKLPLWQGLVGGGVVLLVAAGLAPTLVRSFDAWRAGSLDASPPRESAEDAALASGTVFEAPAGADDAAAITLAYSLALHMHGSISEGTAGWNWHHQQGITYGIDVLWWSDHDSFYYPDGCASADGYDFESGTLVDEIPDWPSGTVEEMQWAIADEANPLSSGTFGTSTPAAYTGTYGGRLTGTASAGGVDERATWYLSVQPHFQYKSLLGQVSMSFAVRPVTTSATGEFQVVVPLSATRSGNSHPSSDDYRSIVFYHGGAGHPALSADELTVYVPIDATEGAWSEVTGDLTALAVAAWGEEEAHDMHAEMVTLRLLASDGEMITYDVDDLAWTMTTREQDLMDEQANYLSAMTGGPAQYLGMEVSELGEGHFNVYGDMPFLPYATDDTLDASALSDWAHGYGALVSYNHMFGVNSNRNSTADRAAAVDAAIDRLIADDAWGVDMLEIGYRQRGGVLSDFLAVWDAVGMSGLYLTGVGAMDVHDEVDFAAATNNFLTYVGLVSLNETNVKTELARGNAWFGDPTLFTNGHFTMTIGSPAISGLKMGAVVVGASGSVPLRLLISEVPAGTRINLVENGVVTQTWNNSTAGRWQQNVTIDPTGGNVVRVEVLSNPGGGPVAFTNPVYFVPSGTTGVPSNRRIIVR